MLKLTESEIRPLLILAFFMAVFVTASNFLVQFPINFFGMQEVLTYGAISYPVTFLITDLSNRRFGKVVARNIVYLGFILGILLCLLFLLPGILYFIFKSGYRYYCPSCNVQIGVDN